jgi:hypothetical protein
MDLADLNYFGMVGSKCLNLNFGFACLSPFEGKVMGSAL